jgi:hypothetical protein
MVAQTITIGVRKFETFITNSTQDSQTRELA